MLPVNHSGHAAYQSFLLEQLRIYYPNPFSIWKDTWDIIERFELLSQNFPDANRLTSYNIL